MAYTCLLKATASAAQPATPPVAQLCCTPQPTVVHTPGAPTRPESTTLPARLATTALTACSSRWWSAPHMLQGLPCPLSSAAFPILHPARTLTTRAKAIMRAARVACLAASSWVAAGKWCRSSLCSPHSLVHHAPLPFYGNH